MDFLAQRQNKPAFSGRPLARLARRRVRAPRCAAERGTTPRSARCSTTNNLGMHSFGPAGILKSLPHPILHSPHIPPRTHLILIPPFSSHRYNRRTGTPRAARCGAAFSGATWRTNPPPRQSRQGSPAERGLVWSQRDQTLEFGHLSYGNFPERRDNLKKSGCGGTDHGGVGWRGGSGCKFRWVLGQLLA